MEVKNILASCNCCITGKPLKDCNKINTVQLNFRASWEFPVWTNTEKGYRHMALAYIHDDCIDPKTKMPVGDIKHAIEFNGDEVIYHPVLVGTTCRRCNRTDSHISQAYATTGNPLYWVEKDLCSACEAKSIYTVYLPGINPERPDLYIIGKWWMGDHGRLEHAVEFQFANKDLSPCEDYLRSIGKVPIGRDQVNDAPQIHSNWL